MCVCVRARACVLLNHVEVVVCVRGGCPLGAELNSCLLPITQALSPSAPPLPYHLQMSDLEARVARYRREKAQLLEALEKRDKVCVYVCVCARAQCGGR